MPTTGLAAVNNSARSSALAKIYENTNNGGTSSNAKGERPLVDLTMGLHMDSDSDSDSDSSDSDTATNDGLVVKVEPKVEDPENQTPPTTPAPPERRTSVQQQSRAASEAHLRKRSCDVTKVSVSSPAVKKRKTAPAPKPVSSKKQPAWMSSSQSEMMSRSRPSSTEVAPTERPPVTNPNRSPCLKHYTCSDALEQAIDGRLYTTYKQDDGEIIHTYNVPIPSHYKVHKDRDSPMRCPVAGCGKCFVAFTKLSNHFAIKHIDCAFQDNCDGTMTEVGSYSRKGTGLLGIIVSRAETPTQRVSVPNRKPFATLVPWPLRIASAISVTSKVLSYIDSKLGTSCHVPSLKSVFAMSQMELLRELPAPWIAYYKDTPINPLQYAYTVAYLTGKEVLPPAGCEQGLNWGHLSSTCVELPQMGDAELEELRLYNGCVGCMYHSALEGYQVSCDWNRERSLPDPASQVDDTKYQAQPTALNTLALVETPVPLPRQLITDISGTLEHAPEAVAEPNSDLPMQEAEAMDVDEHILPPPRPPANSTALPSLPSIGQIQKQPSSQMTTAVVKEEEPQVHSETDPEGLTRVVQAAPDAEAYEEEMTEASPQTRSTMSTTRQPRGHNSTNVGNIPNTDDGEGSDDDMEMEPWEIAPGRVEDAQRRNIGFSIGYVVGQKPVAIAPDIEFNVVVIKPGAIHVWDIAYDKQRICSVARGKVNVQIGDARFRLGENGSFTIYPGGSCAIQKNTLYGDVVLHCTTVGNYTLTRRDAE